MSKSLWLRLKSAIFSTSMLTSVCIGLFLLLWNVIFNLIIYNLSVGPLSIAEMGSLYLHDIYESHARSGFDLFAPILAVLPATTLFCEDYNSGYIKAIIGRVETNRYINETITCSAISGGLAVLLPSLISSIFFIVIGNPNLAENLHPGYSTLFDESIFAGIQFVWGGGLIVAICLVLAFIFGAIWSNFGLCISAISPNRYIALAAPFALYFAMHLFCYRVNLFLILSPVNMLMPMADFMPNMLYPFAYQAVFFCVIALLTRKLIKRRLCDA